MLKPSVNSFKGVFECVCVANFPPLFTGEFSMCRVNNGGCQDLCLLTSEGRVNCSCRGDRKLLEDNTCIGNKNGLKHLDAREVIPHKDTFNMLSLRTILLEYLNRVQE